MNTLSRLQTIPQPPAGETCRGPQVVRVVVDETAGLDFPRVTLAPGDRFLVQNRSQRTLRVAPLDFFGNAFDRVALEPGETCPPMVVTGLWFQVELVADGGRIYPLDVYLAPNSAV